MTQVGCRVSGAVRRCPRGLLSGCQTRAQPPHRHPQSHQSTVQSAPLQHDERVILSCLVIAPTPRPSSVVLRLIAAHGDRASFGRGAVDPWCTNEVRGPYRSMPRKTKDKTQPVRLKDCFAIQRSLPLFVRVQSSLPTSHAARRALRGLENTTPCLFSLSV